MQAALPSRTIHNSGVSQRCNVKTSALQPAQSILRTRLIAELLNGQAAQEKLVGLAEVLEPVNGRLPLIVGRFRCRLPRLPDGDSFRKHLFGRAVLAGPDGIFDDTFNLGGEDGQSPQNLLTPSPRVAERAGAVKHRVAAFS